MRLVLVEVDVDTEHLQVGLVAVFATSHTPSKWSVAREQLDGDIDALVEDLGSIDAVLRKHDVAPPR